MRSQAFRNANNLVFFHCQKSCLSKVSFVDILSVFVLDFCSTHGRFWGVKSFLVPGGDGTASSILWLSSEVVDVNLVGFSQSFFIFIFFSLINRFLFVGSCCNAWTKYSISCTTGSFSVVFEAVCVHAMSSTSKGFCKQADGRAYIKCVL